MKKRPVRTILMLTLEKERIDSLLPQVAGTDLNVIALCMSDEGMPETAVQRVKIADELINRYCSNYLRAYRNKQFEL